MRFLPFALAAAALTTLASAVSAQPRHELSLTTDNDWYAFGGTDREYSQGMELALRAPLGAPGELDHTHVVVALGQALYTPDDLLETRADALRADRPYAGWLFGSAKLDLLRPGWRASLTARAGVVGPHAFGEQIQIAWHSTNRAPEPLGWPHAQVGDALDAGVAARVGTLAAWPARRTGSAELGLDLTPELGCEAGTLRAGCDAGALLRIGLARRGLRDVPTLAEPLAVRVARGDLPVPRPAAELELVAFVSGDAHRVLKDDVQAGDVCTRSGAEWSCGPSWVRLSPWVTAVALGVAAAHGLWRVSASHVWRSAELEAPVVRAQRFGRLAVAYAF